MRLLLIRHTTPAIASGHCYGRLDVSLAASADADLQQALRLIPPVSTVISSPAARCLALARRVADRDTASLHRDARLLELDFGEWEGRRWDDIPREQMDAWASDPWGHAPGQGESVLALWQRLDAFRRERLLQIAAGLNAEPVLIIAHQGPLRVLLAQLLGLPRSAAFDLDIPCGAAGLRRLQLHDGSWRDD